MAVHLPEGSTDPMEQSQQPSFAGADPLNRMQLGKHLTLAAPMGLLIAWAQLNVLHHNGGQALQLKGMKNWIL
jgi:hypothetical protein